jgi:replication factor A1
MEANAMVDVVGVVVTINPSTTVMRKTGTEVQRRALQLRDMSGCSVEVTMWGTFCSNEGQQLQDLCDSGNIPVLAIKGGRLSDFGGKSIGTVSSTQLQVNPNLPQAHQVKDWFEKIGKSTAPLSISKEGGGNLPRSDTRKTISQIKDEGLGRSDKPDWIALRATISFIRTENFCYTACPLPVGDRQCNKKVINNGDGTWRCDRCDRAIAECDYRYLLSVQVQDHTGVTWITAFQEAGEEIMGVSAKELYTWKQDEDPRYRDVIQKLLFSQYVFKLKVKEENYNDELRVKCTAVKSERLDYSSENKVLIDMIRRIARGEPISGATSGVLSGSSAHVAPNYGGGGYSINANNGNDGYVHGTLHHGNEGYNNGMSNINNNSNKYGSRNFMDEKQMGYNASSNYGGGGISGGQTNSCFKCGQGGHWARDCPGQGSVAGGGFGGNASYGGYGGNAGYGGNTRFGRGF